MKHEEVSERHSEMQLQVTAITFKCNSLKRIPVELTGKLNFSLKSKVITENCQRLSVLYVVQCVLVGS